MDRSALENSGTHPGGTGDVYKGRGVYVPHGQKASWIMEGAWALENQFDVAPYFSRMMVSAVLEAILPIIRQDDISQLPCKASIAASPIVTSP